MDGQTLVDDVREDDATALDRLGSDKYLVAVTGASLGTESVLRTVAATAASGRETFAEWADEERDPAASAFASAAETERDHYERVAAELETDVAPVGTVHDALQSTTGTVARAGAMAGRGLVLDATRLQAVNFFVNEADEARADLARELRADASDQVEAGAALLDDCCESDDDWTAARDATRHVVAAAYNEYVDACEDLGIDPKPVC